MTVTQLCHLMLDNAPPSTGNGFLENTSRANPHSVADQGGFAQADPLRGRFLFLDALRGIAALAVVVHHGLEGKHVDGLTSILPGWIVAAVESGGLGVGIFFAISGFVIAHSVYADRVTLPFAGRFMLRRSIRLDPPYWLAIALVLASATLSAMVLPGKAALEVSGSQLLAHLVYLQEMLGHPHLNIVFWTLCLEVQFYLTYVILLWISRNDPGEPLHGRLTTTALALAVLVSLLWPIGVFTEAPWPGSFLAHWHGFLVGVAAYWAWRNPQIAPFFLGLVLAIVAAAWVNGHPFSFVCAATAFVLWFFAVSGRIYSALSWSWLQFLGAISYSLYLIHNPVNGATFRIGYMITGRSHFWEAFWWLGSLAACLAFAAAMWWAVEQPSIHWARKIALRGPRQADAPMANQPESIPLHRTATEL